MTITQRIKRLEELRREGIDWSEMDRAMYGPLPRLISPVSCPPGRHPGGCPHTAEERKAGQ